MIAWTSPGEALVERLVALAREVTGFRQDAVHRDAVRRFASARLAAGLAPAELLARVRSEPALCQALAATVSVRETYFFRHPEHFRLVAGEVAAGRLGCHGELRAWSAGCATGEEAWSLAACLVACAPPAVADRVSVLGTDLLEAHVEVARAGHYAAWSVRDAAPILYPALTRAGSAWRVLAALRAHVGFAPHNLLEPPPARGFDVIFCRNVLVYFDEVAARRALEHLTSALAPGGLVVFGAVDVGAAPPGLERLGGPEASVFVRRAPAAAPPPAKAAPRARVTRPCRPTRRLEPVALHLRVIDCLDRGDREGGARALDQLEREAPRYVPGLLERALWHRRAGRRDAARELLRQVLAAARALPAEQIVAGPEALPARFYAAAAQAFLDQEEPW